MPRSHAALRAFRKLHLYLGVITAPALLFFAFTGALQTFSLHETTQGSGYKSPAWIVSLAQIHKKQTSVVPQRRPRPVEEATKPNRAAGPASDQPVRPVDAPATKPKGHLPMKIFFLIVSIGLFLSALTGIYMAYKYTHRKLLIGGLLAAGTVIPLVLLPF